MGNDHEINEVTVNGVLKRKHRLLMANSQTQIVYSVFSTYGTCF